MWNNTHGGSPSLTRLYIGCVWIHVDVHSSARESLFPAAVCINELADVKGDGVVT